MSDDIFESYNLEAERLDDVYQQIQALPEGELRNKHYDKYKTDKLNLSYMAIRMFEDNLEYPVRLIEEMQKLFEQGYQRDDKGAIEIKDVKAAGKYCDLRQAAQVAKRVRQS